MLLAGDTMNQHFILIFAVLVALAFSAPAIAQESQCLTAVSTSTSVTSATTGTDVTITVTTTGSSCTVSTLVLVSSPSLTVNDPASGQYAGFSAGSTKSFAATAGTTGTYTYYSRGTTSAGSVDSTSQTLQFISPSDMTVSATPSSTTIAHNQMFNLTVDISSSQSSDVLTSYALNLPSGLTRNSGDPASASGTTISASSTKTLSFEIKHSTCFTGSKAITFDLGDTAGSASATVSGNSSCSSASSSSSTTASSGGGGGAAVTATAKHTLAKITTDAPGVVKLSTSSIAIKRLSISVLSEAVDVTISVQKLSNLPSGVAAAAGTTYQYLNISHTNVESKVNNVAIRFVVPTSWLTTAGVAASDVRLYRYTSSWSTFVPTIVNQSDTEIEFEATVPGLSYFTIGAEKPATQEQPPAGEQPPSETPPGEQPAAGEEPPPQGTSAFDSTSVFIVVVVIIVVVFLGWLHYHKRPPKGYVYY